MRVRDMSIDGRSSSWSVTTFVVESNCDVNPFDNRRPSAAADDDDADDAAELITALPPSLPEPPEPELSLLLPDS